jgi:hypothetical protein
MSNIIQVTPVQSHIWRELAYKHKDDQTKLNEVKTIFKMLVQLDEPLAKFQQLFNY